MTLKKLDVTRSFEGADILSAEQIEYHYGIGGLKIYNAWIEINKSQEKNLLTFLEQTSIQHVMMAARNELLLCKKGKIKPIKKAKRSYIKRETFKVNISKVKDSYELVVQGRYIKTYVSEKEAIKERQKIRYELGLKFVHESE